MSNNKLEATFNPDEVADALAKIKHALDSRALHIAVRKLARQFKTIGWNLRNGRMTDEEKLALRWMKMHLAEGRQDLAAEDFLWLGKRLEARDGKR